MRLLLDSNSRLNLVRGYGNGEIVVGEQRITRPLIITPLQLHLDWGAASLPAVREPDLQALFDTGAQIILLGAGDTQLFAHAEVRAICRARGIALECMTLGAACRTYNILASEERPVAAGLFP
jgi:uncharacterized protein